MIYSQGKKEKYDEGIEFLDINSVVSSELNLEGLSEADMSIIRALRG